MTTTVFIAGSRKITRLPAEIEVRLGSIVEKGFEVVIGDADGADAACQSYLANRGYANVTVYCVGHKCRNNAGNWPVREVEASPGARGFEFYAVKDRAMSKVATHGLMLWDRKSKGTLANIENLTRDQKPVVVFVSTSKTVHTLKNARDLSELLKGSTASERPSVATLFNTAR